MDKVPLHPERLPGAMKNTHMNTEWWEDLRETDLGCKEPRWYNSRGFSGFPGGSVG